MSPLLADDSSSTSDVDQRTFNASSSKNISVRRVQAPSKPPRSVRQRYLWVVQHVVVDHCDLKHQESLVHNVVLVLVQRKKMVAERY